MVVQSEYAEGPYPTLLPVIPVFLRRVISLFVNDLTSPVIET